jgi:hypothetical protein
MGLSAELSEVVEVEVGHLRGSFVGSPNMGEQFPEALGMGNDLFKKVLRERFSNWNRRKKCHSDTPRCKEVTRASHKAHIALLTFLNFPLRTVQRMETIV